MSFLPNAAPLADIPLDIERFRAGDGPSLVELFRTIYGGEYPSPSVYDANHLIEANRTGKMISVVARDVEGRVVGHLALVESAPFAGALEVAQGLVHPQYRGIGLLSRLMSSVVAEAERIPNCAALFSTAVCNHVMSQRSLESCGFADTAFEIDYAPARLFAHERSSNGRVATLFQSRTLRPSPELSVYLPRAYASAIIGIFKASGDLRRYLNPRQNLPLPQESDAAITDIAPLDVMRLTVTCAGDDLDTQVDELERQAGHEGRAVAQVLVDMSTPTVDAAVETLRRRGFWFGGVLPRYMNADALLMQKTMACPDFTEIKAHSETARQLLQFVEADWVRASAPILVTWTRGSRGKSSQSR